MGLFSELEENLEKYIEKFFRGRVKGGLQPVDIARQLVREMRKGRRVGLKGVYVPNRYEIYLNEADYEKLKPLLEHLAAEMKEYISAKAAEKKYVLAGPVAIEFSKESGEFGQNGNDTVRIESQYDQLPPEDEENQAPSAEDTLRYVPMKETHHEKDAYSATRRAVLEMNNGEHVELEGDLTSIGRRVSCDVCLADKSVSRKHAVVSRDGFRYYITDQGSTNGTFVNGSRISSIELKPGDVIRMGNTMLTFKVV